MPAAVRRVAGVDGCRAGWVVADGDTVDVVPTFADVLARGYNAIAVDMPIGLPDAGARPCDVEARRRLGPRRSSIFPTPVRAVLGASGYADACARHRAADGRALSVQAFNLLPRIAELDALLTPDDPVYEASPELSFAAMAGGPLAHSKRTPAGRAERVALVGDAPRVAGARDDDVLDAIALLWTGRRIAAGTATRLGDGPTIWV